MPSRVNKSGAAPAVGGAQQWVGPSGRWGGALACISLFSSCQELTCVWARFFPLVLGAQEALGATPSGLCLCHWVCILSVHKRDHVISQSKPPCLLQGILCLQPWQGPCHTLILSTSIKYIFNKNLSTAKHPERALGKQEAGPRGRRAEPWVCKRHWEIAVTTPSQVQNLPSN